MSTPKKAVAKRAASKPAPAPVKREYVATFHFYGKEHVGKGKTIRDAIAAIPLKSAPRGRGVLTITKGKVSKDRILLPIMVQRLFALSPTMREFQLKNVSLLFDL